MNDILKKIKYSRLSQTEKNFLKYSETLTKTIVDDKVFYLNVYDNIVIQVINNKIETDIGILMSFSKYYYYTDINKYTESNNEVVKIIQNFIGKKYIVEFLDI